MARFRKLARRYARHTGDLYGVGYQYRDPQRHSLNFGPFRGLTAGNVARQAQPNYLNTAFCVNINDGMVKQLFEPTETETDANKTTCGAFFFHLADEDIMLEFYRDRAAADELKFDVETSTGIASGFTTGETSAAGLTTEENVTAVQYQGNVYYSTRGFALVQVYDRSTGTRSSVAGSPAGAFHLLMIENNLVAVHQNGDVFEIVWSVDGDPTDWAGAGSGSQVIPAHLGEPRALLPYGHDAILICAYGAYQISPTRTLPPFGFAERDDITGTPWMHSAAANGHQLVYMGNDGSLRMFDGREQTVGHSTDQAPFNNLFPGAFYWSDVNGKVFIPTLSFLFDPVLREYLTSWLDSNGTSLSGSFAVDCHKFPDALHTFRVYSNAGTSRTRIEFRYTGPSAGEDIIFQFGLGDINFGRRVFVEQITLVQAGWAIRPVPFVLSLTAVLDKGATQTKTITNSKSSESEIGLQISGQNIHYYPNISCNSLRIKVGGTIGGALIFDGPFPTSANADGNLDLGVPRNMAHLYRADFSAGLNLSVSLSANQLILNDDEPIDESGNLQFELASSWTLDMGFEDIIIQFVDEDVIAP